MKRTFFYDEKKLEYIPVKKSFKDNIIILSLGFILVFLMGILVGTYLTKGEIVNINSNKNLKIINNQTIGSDEWKDSIFKDYEKRANLYLKDFETPIDSEMLSLAAHNAYDSTGMLVPLELALAQAELESKLGTKGKSPKRNPFNIGEHDSGTTLWFETTFEGIQAYYFFISKKYLKCKNLNTLLKNFSNCNNKRYASSIEYESKLKYLIKKINKKITESGEKSQ